MREVFLNGPIQNSDFNLQERPGKVTAIRLARGLNDILGDRAAPHIWNTVMLANDTRYREYASVQASPQSRREFEASGIEHKYDSDQDMTHPGIVTDADPEVAEYALQTIHSCLKIGDLAISKELVPICTGCGHMVGYSDPCGACGSLESKAEQQLHLTATRDPKQLTTHMQQFYGNVNTRGLRGAAGHHPEKIIYSRTRDFGIELGPLGLKGLVLDPRAGLFMSVLTAAKGIGAEKAIMVLTPNCAMNILAYGEKITNQNGTEFAYALHGHIPYGDLETIVPSYQKYDFTDKEKKLFEYWFLPLVSLQQKLGINPAQLPGLVTHFNRSLRAHESTCQSLNGELKKLRQQIKDGDTSWLMDKHLLATALVAVQN